MLRLSEKNNKGGKMVHILPIEPEQPGNIDDRVADELIVTFKPGASEQGLVDYLRNIVGLADKYEIVPYRMLTSINACAYKVPEDKLDEVMQKLNSEPDVLYAEPSGLYRIMGGESAVQ